MLLCILCAVHVQCSVLGFCIISKFCDKGCFDVSEVQKQEKVVSQLYRRKLFCGGIKEVELRSRHGKFIYNRTSYT